MLKRILCIALAIASIFASTALTSIFAQDGDDDPLTGYKWTLVHNTTDFKKALFNSSVNAGLAGTSIYSSYGRVLFVAKYKDGNGNTRYAYFNSNSDGMDQKVQGVPQLCNMMGTLDTVDGFIPDSEVFYSQTDPGAVWVLANPDKTSTKAGSIGTAYRIINSDGNGNPGTKKLSSLDSIYSNTPWKKEYVSNGYIVDRDYAYDTTYIRGNGLNFKCYSMDGKNENARTSTLDFYVCFQDDNSNGEKTNGNAYIKSFHEGVDIKDATKEALTFYTSGYSLPGQEFYEYSENSFSFSRSWSVSIDNGKPYVFSSVLFDKAVYPNPKFFVDMNKGFTEKNYYNVYNVINNAYETYVENCKADGTKRFNLFGSGWNISSVQNVYEKYIKGIFVNMPNGRYLGTDVNSTATQAEFYVYVGEKYNFNALMDDTNKRTTVISNGDTLRIDSTYVIAPASSVMIEEGGTLIVDGTVFCYGSIDVCGGTLIVKGQLLCTYPPNMSCYFGSNSYALGHGISLHVRNGGVAMVLKSGVILGECGGSTIKMDNGSLYNDGLICVVGDVSVNNYSKLVVNPDAALIQGAVPNAAFPMYDLYNGQFSKYAGYWYSTCFAFPLLYDPPVLFSPIPRYCTSSFSVNNSSVKVEGFFCINSGTYQNVTVSSNEKMKVLLQQTLNTPANNGAI